ncbi:DUF4440 domain-containing protein [Permianibacter sp. IMCC34836]|nr:DUF4440 domain-containing protein [Permianibacter fluminis]
MEIDALVKAFFQVFDNRGGKRPAFDQLHQLFISEALVIKNVGDRPEIYTLTQFIAPREVLLTNGELLDFFEQELAERTDIFGKIAQRFCVYQKSGMQQGQAFQAKGMKTMQFIKTPGGWKIAAVAWDDERPGLMIASDLMRLDQ